MFTWTARIRSAIRGGANNETAAKDEAPTADFGANYDNAYDWYSKDSGLTNTDNVITLYDGQGNVIDAVLVTDEATGTAAGGSETQAAVLAKLGEWLTVDGTVPEGGFVDDVFNANAVVGLKAKGSDKKDGLSIKRNGYKDTNSKADWHLTSGSFGQANAEEVGPAF
ncbi:MAG TPA: hypothetical protein EYN66_04240 [Myxococcales bacterium]|nr:hypothetical protein [Myxococcales bacterium]